MLSLIAVLGEASSKKQLDRAKKILSKKNMEILFVAVVISKVVTFANAKDDDILKIVSKAGFSGEFNEINTEDDYILGVHKINSKIANTTKYPIFIMHGFLTTPMSFFLTGQKNSLPLILADNGHDVFLGSRRGSKYSSKHLHLSIESRDFWDFTWHEIGYYDLKAIIDFILENTNANKIFFVGYSQGNTELLVLLSMRPQYNEVIDQAHLMSCVGAITNVHELGSLLSPLLLNYAKTHDDFYYLNMQSLIPLQVELAKILCSSLRQIRVALCKNIIFFMVGRNHRSTEVDPQTYAKMFEQLSPIVGVKQLLHFAQLIMTSKFQQFDYGRRNIEIYNSTTPPQYDLAKITAPIYLYIGEEDIIFNRKDSDKLAKILPNVVAKKMIRNYNHFDFVYGRNSHKLLYKQILEFIETI
ncbi:hypothetical protein PVAND_004541 [Polypedilum vanderplanki]|uniref:Lipase n=1 Tax=Polypedilum vanderplanki TaxID=319348 RepID=A0A9J6BYG1_POLVA|nr:hypothetical protein PVAND_004541 [Polypedilum vanderplanki]